MMLVFAYTAAVILGVCTLKGGAGKTTTAMLLATCAAADQPVTVIDADTELNAYLWATPAQRSGDPLPFEVVRGDAEGLPRQAREIAATGRIVVIDTPPNSPAAMMSAAIGSDAVVVPVSPSTMDLSRLSRTMGVLEDVRVGRPDMKISVLVTRYAAGTIMADTVQEVLAQHPLLPKMVRELERFKRVFGTTPPRVLLDEYQPNWLALRGMIRGVGDAGA